MDQLAVAVELGIAFFIRTRSGVFLSRTTKPDGPARHRELGTGWPAASAHGSEIGLHRLAPAASTSTASCALAGRPVVRTSLMTARIIAPGVRASSTSGTCAPSTSKGNRSARCSAQAPLLVVVWCTWPTVAPISPLRLTRAAAFDPVDAARSRRPAGGRVTIAIGPLDAAPAARRRALRPDSQETQGKLLKIVPG